jgi:hypothetical protein
MTRTLIPFLAVFLLASSVRCVYVATRQPYHDTGRAELERSAACLARTGTLGDAYGEGTGPTAHCAPLYPGFLAGIYWLLGPDTVPARLAQEAAAILLTSFTIALLPLVGRRVGLHPAAGLCAAVLLALLPFNLWVETSGSWEQPACALVLVGLFLGFVDLHESRWQSRSALVWVAFLLGMAGLLSPSLLPAAGLMMAAEWLVQTGNRRRVLGGALILTIALGVCLTPWIVRNYRAFGGFVPVRSNFGLELWLGNNPEANGRTFPTAWDDADNLNHRLHPFANSEERARLAAIGELAYAKAKQRQALDWITAHPSRFLALTLERVRLFWLPPPDLWSPSTGSRWLRALTQGVLTVGLLVGLVIAFIRQAPARWLFLAAALGPSLPYYVTHVNPRYSYPILWLAVLLFWDASLRLAGFLANRARPSEQPLAPVGNQAA